MPTIIRLVEGDTLTVEDDYRSVYEKLLAAAWREPCEFTAHDGDGSRRVTVNPSYVVYIHEQSATP